MTRIRGIQNVSGVGCHLSCALLILCHSLVPIREALLKMVAFQEEATTDTSSSILLELGKLLREMISEEEETTAVDPSRFFKSFKGYCNAYDLGDATRALTVLLKCIRAVFRVHDPNEEIVEAPLPVQHFQSLYELLFNGTKEQVISGRKLRAENEVTLLRKKPPKQSLLASPFPLDVKGSTKSVPEALQAALEPTKVTGYTWDATTDYEEEEEESIIQQQQQPCGTADDWQTTKQLHLVSLPIFWMLHLQRFEYQNGRVEAMERSMEVPEHLTKLDCNFQLVGGILHEDEDTAREEEDYEGGHYTTLLRADNDKWNWVDGTHLTEVSALTALDLLSGKPGASSRGPTRGTLLVYSRQEESQQEVENLLGRFRESLSQAIGFTLFPCTDDKDDSPQSCIGKRLRIRWSGGKFYAGKVVAYNETSGKHKVEYDDGDVKEYKLHKKVVEWE